MKEILTKIKLRGKSATRIAKIAMNNNIMLYPQGKSKALTFSFDDGEKNDIRLCELFNKYGLKGTFNLNSGLMTKEPSEKSSKVALSQIPQVYKGHEVAVHTVHHPFLEKMTSTEIAVEILDDRRTLEEYTGYVVRGMAYPFGTYNDDVIRIAKDLGIKYSRGVHSHYGFSVPTKWLEMPATCHQADEKIFDIAKTFVEESATKDWRSTVGWLFYIWGHSYEYRNEDDWARMEKLCSYLSNRDDVWYATNIEIYDYVEAYRSLCYSVDLEHVYNPSSKDIWLMHEGKVVMIPSNKEVKL